MHEISDRLARLEVEMKAQTKILIEVCRDGKAAKKAQAAHELVDEKRFGKLETDVFWIKAIGKSALAMVGLSHFWK